MARNEDNVVDGEQENLEINNLRYNTKKIFLFGTLTQKRAFAITKDIINAYEDKKCLGISMYISSYGGLVDSELQVYDAMMMYDHPIKTFCIGKAMSAAVLILASGDSRFISENSRIMIHGVSTGSWGKVTEVERKIEEGRRLQDLGAKLMAKHTKKDEDFYKDLFNCGYDRYITPKEALEWGIVDKILGE